MFKFLHAADIHLDSPLTGLDRYDAAPVQEIRCATRRAFENLVQLAIDEAVQFVLIAGDLYDGNWPDYNTGLFFTSQMVRLRDAGIPVILIAGNHDAANKMTKSLPPVEGVTMLSPSEPQTFALHDLHVAIHGQSFATQAVTNDLSAGYPAAVDGYFNIGLLHTCATGRDGHERYAPCTVEGLRAKRYDYWALGHIHQGEILAREPMIVFPGNIQGRHIREAGPKGCQLVTVDDGEGVDLQTQVLDVFRWETWDVDVSGAETGDEVLERIADHSRDPANNGCDRPRAVRLHVSGICPAHAKLAAEPQRWTNEIRSTMLDAAGNDVWLEKVKLRTTLPPNRDQLAAIEGPIAELVRFITELGSDVKQLQELGSELEPLRRKLPAEIVEGGRVIDLESPDALRGLLEDVRQTLIHRLQPQGGER